jgi:hypothetical protein
VPVDGRAERRAIEHRKDLGLVGKLHRRRAGIAVAGDDMGAEPLGGDDELAAELPGTEEQDFGGGGHGRHSTASPIDRKGIIPAI